MCRRRCDFGGDYWGAVLVAKRARASSRERREFLDELAAYAESLRLQIEMECEGFPAGEAARIRTVVRTNRAAIGVAGVEGTDHLVLTSSIDNLQKGAAGQAVQNLNVRAGWAEATGLEGARTPRAPARQEILA